MLFPAVRGNRLSIFLKIPFNICNVFVSLFILWPVCSVKTRVNILERLSIAPFTPDYSNFYSGFCSRKRAFFPRFFPSFSEVFSVIFCK